MKKILFFMIFACYFLSAQTKSPSNENDAKNKEEEKTLAKKDDNIKLSISNSNEFMGSWKNDMPLLEIYGNIYEKNRIKIERYQGTPFIETISFGDGNKGYYKLSNSEAEKEFEYQIRENNILVVAYGTLLNPKIDMYKYYKLSNNNIFMYSTKLSYTVGKKYLVLKKIEKNDDSEEKSKN